MRPRGVLGLLGNGFDNSGSLDGDAARASGLAGAGPAPQPLARAPRARCGIFESVERREFRHEQPIDLAGLRDLAVSRSRVALMSPGERRQLLVDLGLLWDEHVGTERAPLAWRTCVLRARGLRARA